MRKFILSVCLALSLVLAPIAECGKAPSGFDGKVYNSVVALYASSKQAGIKDRFICTAEVVKKVDGGYILLSAGHCTPVNDELPPDMTFKVSDDLGQPLSDVYLLKAVLTDETYKGPYTDYSLFYFPTSKKYNVLQLGDEKDVRVGDKTVDVNFSLGAAKMTSKGTVNTTVGKVMGLDGLLLVDEFDTHGASGSVVVDERTHKVIGILVMGVDGATFPSIVESINTVKSEIENVQVKVTPKKGQFLFIDSHLVDLTQKAE